MLGKVNFNLEENPPLENGVKKLAGTVYHEYTGVLYEVINIKRISM
jgi:hypothetical protein